MGDEFPVYRVAAVQASPAFMDREASLEKARRLVAEAGSNGAQLAVFPETWLPGFPIWIERAPGTALWDHQPAKDAFTRLVANAVEVPGPAVEALCEAAAEAGCGVVMGVNERQGGGSPARSTTPLSTSAPTGAFWASTASSSPPTRSA